MYLNFPNGQEEALTGIEVMLMQSGASCVFFFFKCNSVYSTGIQPVLKTVIAFYKLGFMFTLILHYFTTRQTNFSFRCVLMEIWVLL